MKLTVFFDGQYWVGVVEHAEDVNLKARKHIFGAEPYDADVMEFVQNRMMDLLQSTTQTLEVVPPLDRKMNPKRLARLAGQETRSTGVSTLAQQAIKLDLEARKLERRLVRKRKSEEEKERKRQLKLQKAKEKHRGR